MSDPVAVTGSLDVAHFQFLLKGIRTGGPPILIHIDSAGFCFEPARLSRQHPDSRVARLIGAHNIYPDDYAF